MTPNQRLTRRAQRARASLPVARLAAHRSRGAEKVGVAAAVNPDAFSSLAGAPKSQLNIGKSIFFDERIKTTDSGLVQVLLADGSTFTVGPDSDLVINKFVHNSVERRKARLLHAFSVRRAAICRRCLSKKRSRRKGRRCRLARLVGARRHRPDEVNGPEPAKFVFVFGKYLASKRRSVSLR
jgi:hypothetical protein